jgi:RNA polymerase sigma-70 factor (ECF subfamily)
MTDVSPPRDSTAGEGSFEALFIAHHRAVLAYCARRSSPWDAWDVASEVFVVAWRRLDEVPPASEARAWLIGVAFKVLANQRRGEKRRARLLRRVDQITAWVPMPDEQLLRIEEDHQLLDALARLSTRDQEIIKLTLWEELTPPEIASVLGISRDSVDQRYSRAKKRLSRQLEVTAPKRRPATQTTAPGGGVT